MLNVGVDSNSEVLIGSFFTSSSTKKKKNEYSKNEIQVNNQII